MKKIRTCVHISDSCEKFFPVRPVVHKFSRNNTLLYIHTFYCISPEINFRKSNSDLPYMQNFDRKITQIQFP